MKRKTINGIVAILIIVLLTSGICCMGYAARNDAGEWFKNGDLTTWHWTDNTPAEDNAPDIPDNQDNSESAVNIPYSVKAASARATTPNFFDFYSWKNKQNGFSDKYGSEHEYFISFETVFVSINGFDNIEILCNSYGFYGDGFDYLFVALDMNDDSISTWENVSFVDGYSHSVPRGDEDYFSCSEIERIDQYLYCFTLTSGAVTLDKTIHLEISCTATVLSLPEEPTKEGHTFVGWYLDEDLTIPYNGEFITSDMTFYAKFEINKYEVTFDGNGITNPAAKKVNWNTSVTCPEVSRTGYNFIGWYYSDGTEYNNQPIKDNVTLTARWEIKTFTITFVVDGEVYDTMEVEYGTSLIKVVQNADKRNYEVLSVFSENGVAVNDISAVSVLENYSMEVREMQGVEKVVNIVKNNLWYILGGFAAVVFACCIVGVIAKRKG